MLLPYSADDRALLDAAQHMRLREFFVELNQCVLETTSDDRLIVHCSNPVDVAPITSDLETFKHFAYLATGVSCISFYYEGTELFQVAITGELQVNPESDLPEVECSLSFYGEGFIMATATLERAETKQPQVSDPPQNGNALPAISLAEISADLEQPIEVVRDWFQSNGVLVLGFMSYELVPAATAAAAYDHFEPLLLQQRRAKRGLVPTAPAEQNGHAAKSKATKPAAKPAAKAKPMATKAAASDAAAKRKPGPRAGSRSAKPAVRATKTKA